MNVALSRLKDIATAVLHAAEAMELEQVLERIAQTAKELVETRYAALGIPNGIGGLRYFKTAGMTQEEIQMMEHSPHGRGLLGVIMQERRTIRLEHIRNDSRSIGFPKHHPFMDSFLGVPIQMGQQLFGMLYLCDKENGYTFNEFDELLVESLAGYAALAIATAQISQQQNRVRLLEERERIGMELHDGVIQSLYGIGMQTQLLRFNETVHPNELDPIIHGLDNVIEDIRDYILQLRQRGENNISMRDCFLQMVTRLYLPLSIRVEVNAPDTRPPFMPAAFESLCLIVNEAISNAVRHANATLIRLEAHQEGGKFVVFVEDDGNGFDVHTASTNGDSGGLGLRNMQHRARMYGGEVSIVSAPNEGTRLTIYFPMRVH